MKKFECGMIVPGCHWQTRAATDADLVARAVEHMRQAHGETMIRETLVKRIKTAIADDRATERDAAA
ncbi:DUF1059 domain-containing protein [Pseudohoeflea coraliihabitans]|uniref:DUF1059 domain-containing protein n=1 Tax=Pseudohoeflea coraliihabitans TaxID=2860393 RepID=A0ABS6WJK2_9HYPH|nr:DUF1059 domain-containing protein [Pseudohoeflea sp. DP4N28-3]MBW3096122.1 DUF1059 domain-containing protein [Pseudohoeflea sp. DP4N28-3]